MRFHITLIFLALAAIAGCTAEYESKILKGIETYKQGSIDDGMLLVAEGLVGSSRLAKFKKGEPAVSGNVVFTRSGDTVKLWYPCAASLDAPADFKYLACDPDTGQIAATNGLELRVFSKGGSAEQKAVISEDRKDKADSIVMTGNSVYYYAGRQLNRYSLADKKSASVARGGKMQPPFIGIPFHSHLQKAGGSVIVTLGIAGDYSSHIVDLAADSIHMKDVKVNSPRMRFSEGKLWYVSGITGMWYLAELTVASKKKDEIFKLRDLSDVAFFPGGMLFEDREGLWAVLSAPRLFMKLPPQLKIAGMAGGAVLISLEHATYLIDGTRFATWLRFLAEKAPTLCALKKY